MLPLACGGHAAHRGNISSVCVPNRARGHQDPTSVHGMLGSSVGVLGGCGGGGGGGVGVLGGEERGKVCMYGWRG